MRWQAILWMLISFCMLATSSIAAPTEVTLILSHDSVKPGETITAGVRLKMLPGWHTYWRNPGASGDATRIKWKLPAGITAGEPQWPAPRQLVEDDITTYIYENEAVLLVPITIAANAPPGSVDLSAKVSWLQCEKQCVPGSGEVHATIQIGNDSKLSGDRAILDEWKAQMPLPLPDSAVVATWEPEGTNGLRPLIIQVPGNSGAINCDFFSYDSEKSEAQPGSEVIPPKEDQTRFRKLFKKIDGDWPTNLTGLLIQHLPGEKTVTYEVTLKPGMQAVAAPTRSTDANAPVAPTKLAPQSLALMLLYAFIGGIILNAMPCVLPVIALKILGFVSESKSDKPRIRKLGLAYGAGVLCSFFALAAMVISVKLLGHSASWGMQFQNPQFLVIMTTLVLLVSLNLFGVFEVILSGRIMGTAGDLASHSGYAGAFMNGVLATILATPCTAPFLGTALGFAFAQPPAIIMLVFLTIGVGVAAPYLILSWQPEWLKFLPKPGVWMERFKVAMGFPMLATVIWLYTLATPAFGDSGDVFLGIFLVVVALIAWIYGQFIQRGRTGQTLAFVVCASLLVGSVWGILERKLNWRHPAPVTTASTTSAPGQIEWQKWSPDALKQARASGRPVLVDFTAKWCLVCQLNKKSSIDIPETQKKLKEINAIALIEDSYEKNDTVIAELNSHQRAGVPLVLVYPKNPQSPPIVLPELLTPSIVMNALEEAAKN